jgi:hypothetical protein
MESKPDPETQKRFSKKVRKKIHRKGVTQKRWDKLRAQRVFYYVQFDCFLLKKSFVPQRLCSDYLLSLRLCGKAIALLDFYLMPRYIEPVIVL